MTDTRKDRNAQAGSDDRIVLGSRSHRHLSQSVLLDEAIAPRHIRLTIALLCSALAAFLVWAALAELDEVATAPGQIVPSGAVQVVQHQDGGTVAKIAVSEGERVAAGQLLLSLDQVETEAELKVAEARYWGLTARVARLAAQTEGRAELAGLDKVPSQYADLVREQQAVLDSSRAAVANQEKVLRAQAAQHEADLARVRRQIDTGLDEVRILREVAGIRTDLERDKLVSKVQTLESQRALVVQEGDLDKLRAQRSAARAAVSEAHARLDTLLSDRRQAAHEELGSASAEQAQVGELLVKLRKRLERVRIQAPVRGIVQDLKFRTLGGVIPPGAVVLSVVPVEDVLQAEVRISTTDIGHVKVGQPVRVKVLTYDFLRYGTVSGRLHGVSATSFVDDKGTPYFKGIVRLSRDHVGAEPAHLPVLPGMTVVCDIITDHKTVLQYLARPVVVAFRQGLRER
ncbi:MAG TPA: HlyD family type I secretion periplasmic adaptor subunit [Burkholderiales bacterium]|jgi:HlyD family secretion protein/adhesin transport system membrane fusion protein|nr:HlyD family type I secretion periplasmic adaptor subunit [Burkholderiales bacterium]